MKDSLINSYYAAVERTNEDAPRLKGGPDTFRNGWETAMAVIRRDLLGED